MQIHKRQLGRQLVTNLQQQKNKFSEKAQFLQQKEKTFLGSYHLMTSHIKNQEESQDLHINTQIKHFYQQRKNNLLFQRWKLKREQTAETIDFLNDSKLLRLDRSKEQQQRKPQNDFNLAKTVTQWNDVIQKTKKQRAQIPRHFLIKSHKFYMKNKGNQVQKQKVKQKRSNQINKERHQLIQANVDNQSNEIQHFKYIRSEISTNQKYIAPWAQQLYQRLYQGRSKISRQKSHRNDKSYKIKKTQFVNIIRQSILSSKLLTKAQIEELFDKLKDENVSIWRASILNYNHAKLKRIQNYEKLRRSVQRR